MTGQLHSQLDARFVMRSRQYTAALRAVDGRLVMSTLAYADEVVPVEEVEELQASTRSTCRTAR